MQADVSADPVFSLVPSRPRQVQTLRSGKTFQEVLQRRVGDRLASGSASSDARSRVHRPARASATRSLSLSAAPLEMTSPAEPPSFSSGAQAQGSGAPAEMPPRLQELARFLASLPGQTLPVPADKAPAVADLLLQAGLPQEEVDRLLFNPETPEARLSLEALSAAWQRVQEASPTALGQTLAGGQAGLVEQVQDLRQDREYQRLWESPSLSRELLPVVRLALTRLGVSPREMAGLEEEAAAGGVSLARIWEILQNSGGGSPAQAGGSTRLPTLELADQQPVGEKELEDWRQLLQAAGLKPAEVEELLGGNFPASQKDLKATLLALAPETPSPEAPPEPKPLYLPESLRLGVYRSGQEKGEQSQSWGGGPGGRGSGGPFSQKGESASVFTPQMAAETAAFVPNPAAAPSLSLAAGATGTAGTLNPLPWQALAPEVREALWSQVQSGIMTNLHPGENQVSLNLNPPDLGQIQLTLRLTGQELAVTAVATRPEVAELAAQGATQLLQTLAQQGLVLTQFQVQVHPAPGLKAPAAFAGSREKGLGAEDRQSTAQRRRTTEVDRFV